MANISERELRRIRREQDALEREKIRLRQELSQQRDRYIEEQRQRRIQADAYLGRTEAHQNLHPSEDHQYTSEPSLTEATAGDIIDESKDRRDKDDRDKEYHVERSLNRTVGESLLTLDQTHESLHENENQDGQAVRARTMTEDQKETIRKPSHMTERSTEMQELDLCRRLQELRRQTSSTKKELVTGIGWQQQEPEQDQIVRRKIFPSDGQELSKGYCYTPRYDKDRTTEFPSTKAARIQMDDLRMYDRGHFHRNDGHREEQIKARKDTDKPIGTEYRLAAVSIDNPIRTQVRTSKADQELKTMGYPREVAERDMFLLAERNRQSRDDDVFISDKAIEEETILQDRLEKLEFQEKLIEEENRAREQEEAEINERLNLIKLKQWQLEEHRRKTQRLSDMREKQEQLESSLQRKIEEQIRHDRKLRLLRQEEIRLTEEVMKREPCSMGQESGHFPKIDLDIKPPDIDQ